jgi:hypothetical protein
MNLGEESLKIMENLLTNHQLYANMVPHYTYAARGACATSALSVAHLAKFKKALSLPLGGH